MGDLQHYFHGKIAIINYKIATHEGNANQRLASQANKILLLPKSEVPKKFASKYCELLDLIEQTVSNMPGLMIPIRLGRIQNRTAVKYIKLLMEIEELLDELEGDNY
jgi:hypothetical protein